MKYTAWIVAASIITIIALSGSIYYFMSITSQDSEALLNIDNLTALTNGQVSFNVTLNESESEVLEAVILNNTSYSWSDGSNETATIFKGQTKHWSVNIGNLKNGTNFQVVVESQSKSVSTDVIVKTQSSEPTDNSDDGPSEPNDDFQNIYDNYGGVGLFDEGIHVIVTQQDPIKIRNDYEILNNYWKMLAEHETTTATDQEFISLILSRGDKPTGGYAINVESFGWLESYPVKFRFQVNITDPGIGVVVTQALTNPLVLVPIGKLTPGEYHIEVNITWFTQIMDENGSVTYTPIMTFAPIEWKKTLTITGIQEPTDSIIFNVTVNEIKAPDLTVQIVLNDGLNEAEARKIIEAAFVQTMGNQTIHELETLNQNEKTITAHYIWGIDESDLGHIFDLTVDLDNQTITITHCR